jgi:hypothetical protein
MPACANWWQTDGCECGIPCLWQSMGLLRRLDIIVVALMLARVIAVVGWAAYRYQSTRRSPATDTNGRKTFAAELSLRLYTLRSISQTAPFLGLVGSCIGIFDSFIGVGMQRGTALAIINLNLSRALITTAAAYLVAVPAIWSHNYLWTLLGSLNLEISESAHETVRRSERCIGIAQSLPLREQFSRLPSSAVTVAPCLALVIAGFMTFSAFDVTKGLSVGLLGPEGRAARTQYFTTDPVVVVVAVARGADDDPLLFVNSKETTWDELGNTVRRELELRPRRVTYVEAESGTQWRDVANVIDIVQLDASVVLSTTKPDMKSLQRNHQGVEKNASQSKHRHNAH